MLAFAPDWLSIMSLVTSVIVSVGMIIYALRKFLRDLITELMSENIDTLKVQINEVKTGQRLLELRVAELERKMGQK